MMVLHEKLAHLTPEQVDDLVKRYNEGENLASLVKAFSIDAKPAGLVHLLPPVVHKDLLCFYCQDTHLISKQPARTFEPRRPVPPHCPKCGHRPVDWCRCKLCWEKEQAERRLSDKKKRDLIVAACTREVDVPSPEDLTLHDAVFLPTLARHAVTDDLGYLKPYHKFDKTLAPLPECVQDILSHLYKSGLIAISPDSDVHAFDFDEAATEIESHNATRVLWTFLPGLEGESKRDYLMRLKTLASADDWPDRWRRDMPALWHFIAQSECLAHFEYLLKKRKYKKNLLDQKTRAFFDSLLAEFPPSGIFYFTWSAVKDTSHEIAKKFIPYSKRKEMFLEAIERKADEARASGRELRHFGLDNRCHQTDVSAAFFNDFLNLGDDAFKIIPPRPDGRCEGTSILTSTTRR